MGKTGFPAERCGMALTAQPLLSNTTPSSSRPGVPQLLIVPTNLKRNCFRKNRASGLPGCAVCTVRPKLPIIYSCVLWWIRADSNATTKTKTYASLRVIDSSDHLYCIYPSPLSSNIKWLLDTTVPCFGAHCWKFLCWCSAGCLHWCGNYEEPTD